MDIHKNYKLLMSKCFVNLKNLYLKENNFNYYYKDEVLF